VRAIWVGSCNKEGNPKDYHSRGLESPAREDRIERNPKVAVLPPMGEGHQPVEEKELEKTKKAEVANVHQARR
jgi:hypothetical protein